MPLRFINVCKLSINISTLTPKYLNYTMKYGKMTSENDGVLRRHVNMVCLKGRDWGIGCGRWEAWKFLNVGLPYHFRWPTRGVRTNRSHVSQAYDLQLTTIFSPMASGKDMAQRLHHETYALCINMLGLDPCMINMATHLTHQIRCPPFNNQIHGIAQDFIWGNSRVCNPVKKTGSRLDNLMGTSLILTDLWTHANGPPW